MSGHSNSPFIPLDDGRISQLMRAAQQAHIDNAKALLYGVSPDVRDSTGRTAFSWVASYDWSQSPNDPAAPDRFMRFLLSRGANPNLGDIHGETPLHWAAKAGDHRMVDLLLQKDVLPDLQDHRGRTPLSRAAERNHPRVVEILLALPKADPDCKDGWGRTPLSLAAEGWHRETATILLDHGASVDIHDNEGQIPLWWFINNAAKRSEMDQSAPEKQEDFQQWLAMLSPNNSVEPMTKARRTFLSWACERGDIQLVQHLLRTPWADPNSIDRYRKTPLIYALEWSHYNVADMLIAGTGAGPNNHWKKDMVSLRIMVQECRSRLLRPFFERYKPNLEEEDQYSSISLVRLALQTGDRATVTVLLNHGASIQDLENGDWFGPCSTGRTTADMMILNARTGTKYGSIPVMQMTLHDGERRAVEALLDYRARILQLEEKEDDFSRYNTIKPSVAVDIMALRDRRKDVRWILDDTLTDAIRDLPKTSDETHLILFRENHRWKTYCQMSHLPNELKFSLGNKSPCRTFTLSIRMSLTTSATGLPTTTDVPIYTYETDDYTLRTIEWSVLEAPPKTIHYFSNLPSGRIPQNDLEFVQLFMNTWKEDWLACCQEGRKYLSRLRSRQLTARGKNNHLIDTIAENMLKWTQIQGTLAAQVTEARSFVSQYQRFSETRHFSENINKTIDLLERDVSNQIEKMEQIVRDLLQIEFAWVSINEAHRSTSVATSMKRLSWITFIFLPLTFASTLFGMNVDILRDDPTWRWYPLVGGGLLLLTVAVWVATKFFDVDTWVTQKVQDLVRRPTHKR